MSEFHVLVLGGSGNFGARIVRALQADSGMRVTAARRRAGSVPGAASVPGIALDCRSPSFAAELRALAPDLVIHCVGPFQGQDYHVAEAALAAGAHYVDLADGREFVAGFAAAMCDTAIHHGRLAVSGASTLPALSSAVVDELSGSLRSIDSIDITIAPGQLAPRGVATLAAVMSYLGKPVEVWKDARWQRAAGWMGARRIRLDIGDRWGSLCDVPDLALFPERYPGVRDVRFQAALEFPAQQAALWTLAAARRAGMPFPVERWAIGMHRLAKLFDPLAGPWGGMCVNIEGCNQAGERVRRSWQLRAPALDGPEIPCMASILLARRLAREQKWQPGACACMGLLKLVEFEPLFLQWNIKTRIEEIPA